MDDAAKKVHRTFAVSLFNRAWELLDKGVRTADEDVEMLNASHASLYHWMQVGDAQNFNIGEWQLARVYAILKRAEPALHHGRRSLEIAEKATLPPFFIAYSHEALARGYALAGDADSMRKHLNSARTFTESVIKAEDRAMILKDLEGITL